MDPSQEPKASQRPSGEQGNTLLMVMVFAAILGAMIPLFMQMSRDSTMGAAESRISASRKLLFTNVQSFANSPAALLQASFQAALYTAPSPTPTPPMPTSAPATPLFNSCLWECIFGPNTANATSPASSCQSQLTTQGITRVATDQAHCQAYDNAAGRGNAEIWYDMTLVYTNSTEIIGGRMNDNAAVSYVDYTYDGIACTATQPDVLCPFRVRVQFHPVCAGDPLAATVPSPRPTSPALVALGGYVYCRQAATIQTRVIVDWNPNTPAPQAGRGGRAVYAIPLDSAYSLLNATTKLSLAELIQIPVYAGAPVAGDPILGASFKK